MFLKKRYEVSLRRVRDTVRIREGDDAITLTVDGEAMRMVTALNAARQQMLGVTNETPAEAQQAAARTFATAIFGADQADTLMNFYNGDAACVINVCGRYFSDRLAGIIAKAQRR